MTVEILIVVVLIGALVLWAVTRNTNDVDPPIIKDVEPPILEEVVEQESAPVKKASARKTATKKPATKKTTTTGAKRGRKPKTSA